MPALKYWNGTAWATLLGGGSPSTDVAHAASVFQIANFGIANVTPTAIPWDGQRYVTDGYFNASDPYRFIVPGGLGGIHVVTFSVLFPPHETNRGTRAAWIQKEPGSNPRYAQTEVEGQLGASTGLSGTAIMNLNGGDRVLIYAFHSLGGGWAISSESMFSIARLGRIT